MGWNYLSIPKLQRLHRWSLGMDKQFHPIFYNGCNYLSMLGLKLNHASKSGQWMIWNLNRPISMAPKRWTIDSVVGLSSRDNMHDVDRLRLTACPRKRGYVPLCWAYMSMSYLTNRVIHIPILMVYIEVASLAVVILAKSYKTQTVRAIDLIHKSHSAPVPYLIMHHAEKKFEHFCPEWCIVGYRTGVLCFFDIGHVLCVVQRIICASC